MLAGRLSVEVLSLNATSGPVDVRTVHFSLKPLESTAIFSEHADALAHRLHLPNLTSDWQSGYITHVTAVISLPDSKAVSGQLRGDDGMPCASCDKRELSKPQAGFDHQHHPFVSIVKIAYHLLRHCIELVQNSCKLLPKLAQIAAQHQPPESRGDCLCNSSSPSQLSTGLDHLAAPNRDYFSALTAVPDQKVVDDFAAVPSRSEATVFYTDMKALQLVDQPNITASHFKLLSPHAVQFVVSSSHVSLYVAVEACVPGRFSDSSFLLKPWKPETLGFLSHQHLQSTKELSSCLSFLSLTDTRLTL